MVLITETTTGLRSVGDRQTGEPASAEWSVKTVVKHKYNLGVQKGIAFR